MNVKAISKKHHPAINEKTIQPKHSVELVHSGEDYFDRLHKIISQSKIELHIQTYIFENDSTGKMIANALKEAASRNVKVYVLLDAYGSYSLSGKFIKDLVEHGINIRFFSPLFSTSSFYIGRRLHHKIVVADGTTTLIGGINIGDRYRGSETKVAWLDYAVQIENSEIANHLEKFCRNIYFKKRRMRRKNNKYIVHLQRDILVSILQNDWLKRKNDIYKSYIKAITNAKGEVIIVGSYFLPGKRLTNVLKTAALNGVQIKLILSGISDVPLLRRATCYLYSSLLNHNIELYEWNKSVLHGKVAVVKGKWTTIGSFNLNHLSSYGSIEMNVEINSPEFAKKTTIHFNDIISQCENITHKTLKTRNGLFTNALNWLSYRFVRIALIIVTYTPHKRFGKLFVNINR